MGVFRGRKCQNVHKVTKTYEEISAPLIQQDVDMTPQIRLQHRTM